jgi:hypothetical protein
MVHLLLFCGLFILGQLLYLLKRAAYAVRNPNNPTASRRDFLYRNWDVLLFRGGLDQILFWVWVSWPDGITHLIALTGLSWNFNIPLNGITAVVAGLVSELILDTISLKVPFLQTEIPQVNGVYKKQP